MDFQYDVFETTHEFKGKTYDAIAGRMSIPGKLEPGGIICVGSHCKNGKDVSIRWTFYWDKNGNFISSLWDTKPYSPFSIPANKNGTANLLKRKGYTKQFYKLTEMVVAKFGIPIEDPITGKFINPPNIGEKQKPKSSILPLIFFGGIILYLIFKGGQ